MASTLEMLIRAKYISQGAGTLESELRTIKRTLTDLGKTDLTVNLEKFLPSPDSLSNVQEALARVTERINALRQAQLAAFGQGSEGGNLAGSVLEKDISNLEGQLRTLNKVIEATKQKDFNLADYILSDSDVASLTTNIEAVKQEVTSLQQAISKAKLTGDTDAENAFQTRLKEATRELKAYETAVKSIQANKQVNLADYVLSERDTVDLKVRLRTVREEIQQLKNSLGKATVMDSDDQGLIQKQLKEAQATERMLQQIVSDTKNIEPIRLDEYIASESSVQNVRQRVAQMEASIKRLRDAAQAAFGQGKIGDEAGKEFLKQAANIEQMKRSLEKTIPTIEKTGFSIENLLTNKLTRLGFGIFALQSSLRTFTQLIGGVFNTIAEGAAALDRSKSFELILSGQGVDPTGMANKLRQASGGLVEMNKAMYGTLELARAGYPDLAAQSDALLKIATSAAIVTGDLSQLSTIQEKLVRGIERGSPRLIDDSGIVLKLGDVNEQYAASLGKTVEQLTAAEKAHATFNAVLKEGERINQMAEQMDSASVKVQRLKTEFAEAATILKESFAIAVINIADAMGEADPAVKNFTASVSDFNDLTKAGEYDQFIQSLYSIRGAAAIAGSMIAALFNIVEEGVKRTITNWSFFPKFFMKGWEGMGYSIDLVVAKLMGMDGVAQVAAANLNRNLEEGRALIEGYRGPLQSWNEIVNQTVGDMNEIFKAAGLIQGKMATGIAPVIGPDGEETVAQASQTNTDLGKILRERARMSEDIEYERVNKIKDINRDHADKMRDIARKLADALADIDRDLAQKLADLAQDRADKLADIAQDLADKISDIDQDLSDKLVDIQQDANDKRQDAQDDYNKGLLDAEEEYQKKLRDIQRKYEASRLSALIDRDARALFEAEKQREQDLQDAVDTAEEKRKEELEKLLEKLEDINKAEEQQRQDAIRNAEQRRRDAQQAADRARRDALQNYERARRDAQQDAERRRREARENAAQERRDALEDQARAREDLRQWYRDKLRDLQRYHQDELQEYASQYSSINDLTGQFMETQIDAWGNFQEVIRGNREWIGIGSPTDPTTGEDFPDWRNPANVYAGGRCNRGSSQITTGADGRQYVCIGNYWRLFTGVGGQSAGTQMVGVSGGTGGFAAAGGGRAGTQRIILEVRSDEAMALIKSGAYEAIMEVME